MINSRRFKDWMLREHWNDIFGFDKEVFYKRKNDNDEKPITPFNLEQMMNYLALHDLGTKKANIKFINEICWGDGPGAIRVWLGTGLNVMIERQSYDLEGNLRWISKRVYQIDQSGYGGFEDAISNEILDEVKKLDKKPMDSPVREYKELEALVHHTAGAIRRTARDIFIFEGIRKVDANNYIVRLSVRGHGVEAQDQQRVEENQTWFNYDEKSGLIRIFNYNVESGKNQHEWAIMASDTDWYFSPNQGRDEISETIANTLHWY